MGAKNANIDLKGIIDKLRAHGQEMRNKASDVKLFDMEKYYNKLMKKVLD